METRSNQILVGSVVLGLLAALAVFIVWLSQIGDGAEPADVVSAERSTVGQTIGQVPAGQEKIDPADPAHDAYHDAVAWGEGDLHKSDSAVFPTVSRFTYADPDSEAAVRYARGFEIGPFRAKVYARHAADLGGSASARELFLKPGGAAPDSHHRQSAALPSPGAPSVNTTSPFSASCKSASSASSRSTVNGSQYPSSSGACVSESNVRKSMTSRTTASATSRRDGASGRWRQWRPGR